MNEETTNLYVGKEFFAGVTPESFAELIKRFMGDEAAAYYLDLISPNDRVCIECDEVYKTQEHYQDVIRDALEILETVEPKKAWATSLKRAISLLHAES